MLDGDKSVVLHGECADKLIVSARHVRRPARPRRASALFLVDATAPGVSRARLSDAGRPARRRSHVQPRRAPKPRAAIGEPGAAFPLIERVVDEAIAALCAEAVGAMAAMQETTVDYLKTRKQFGVAIGSFQVLQHRAVDMFVALEQARSMAMFATMMADEPDARERRHGDVGGEGADRPLRPLRRPGRRCSCTAASA